MQTASLSETVSQSGHLTDPLVGLLMRWLDLGEIDRRAFLAMTDELSASSALIETSVIELCARFRDLAEAATAQTARVQQIAVIARSVNVDGQAIPIAEATERVAQALNEGIAALQDASHRAERTAAALDSVERDVSEAEDCVKRIAAINTTTRFVALNAMIEASRSQGSSGAFRVIANEIKDLSLATNSASGMVHDQIDRIARAVRSARQQLRTIGGRDRDDRTDTSLRLARVLDGMTAQSRQLGTILAEASQAAAEIDRSVAQMITSAQFQDRVTQHLAHVSNALETLGDIAADLQGDTRRQVDVLRDRNEVDLSVLHRLLDQQTLSAVRRRFLQRLVDGTAPHVIEESHGGEVELF